jgi:hypothetical protein
VRSARVVHEKPGATAVTLVVDKATLILRRKCPIGAMLSDLPDNSSRTKGRDVAYKKFLTARGLCGHQGCLKPRVGLKKNVKKSSFFFPFFAILFLMCFLYTDFSNVSVI